MAANQQARSFYGWRVVVAVFVLATFGWGVGFYGPPIYLHTVHETRGWALDIISTAVTVHFLFGAIVIANLPKLYRRFGVARVTKAGSIGLAVGVVGWAVAREPWQLFVAVLLSGGGWVTMGAAAVNSIVAPWFIRMRPVALASAYNGSSVGGVVFSPLWVGAIGLLGFPGAAVVVGLVMIVTIWILADMYYRKTPELMGLKADGDAANATPSPPTKFQKPLSRKQLWSDWRFVTLAAGMALGLFAQIGLLNHLFSLLAPPLGAQLAGVAMGAATAAAIAGRTLMAWMMPLGGDRRLFGCGNYIIQILGSLAFAFAAGENVPLLLLGVVLFGAGIGNTTSLPPLIAQSEFRNEDVSRVVPLIVAIGQATYAFAPAMFGFLREFGSASSSALVEAAPLVFITAALVQASGALAFLIGRQNKK